MTAIDRYGSVLREGYKVVDLRQGHTGRGTVLGTGGSAAVNMVLVRWETTDDDEWVHSQDVAWADTVFEGRRRR